ncbi:hypothetical protein FOCC_FOCC014842 [Frankliniella occidentalis]|nr:hypothetical protein FOCC_FOCC014842 [Frankliniella occidentalis]
MVCVVPDEENFMMVHVLIMGPEGTPYEKGFFYFLVTFPVNYPWSPPQVQFMTTGSGTVRFNPNLYTCGKVCLSILGTWPGPSWSPSMSLSSVILSIQSLLCEYPYHNEPGHEMEKDLGDSVQYNEVILHETIRVAVVGMIRNDALLIMPPALELYMQQQFALHVDFYMSVAQKKETLTGNQIIDPLYGETSTRYFQYSSLLSDLRSISDLMMITHSEA